MLWAFSRALFGHLVGLPCIQNGCIINYKFSGELSALAITHSFVFKFKSMYCNIYTQQANHFELRAINNLQTTSVSLTFSAPASGAPDCSQILNNVHMSSTCHTKLATCSQLNQLCQNTTKLSISLQIYTWITNLQQQTCCMDHGVGLSWQVPSKIHHAVCDNLHYVCQYQQRKDDLCQMTLTSVEEGHDDCQIRSRYRDHWKNCDNIVKEISESSITVIEKHLWCSFIDSREMTTRTRCNCHDHNFLVTIRVFIYEDKYHGETESKRPLSMVGSPTQKICHGLGHL